MGEVRQLFELNEFKAYQVAHHWRDFLCTVNLKFLLDKIEPKQSGCGAIYEIPDHRVMPDESLAIADMSEIRYAEPHYHTNGEWEIYIILRGSGFCVVGDKNLAVEPDTVVVIPPETAHYTVPDPDSELIMAVVNMPPFSEENYIPLESTDGRVFFDYEKFRQHIRES